MKSLSRVSNTREFTSNMKVKSLLTTAIVCATMFASIALPTARADESASYDVRPVPVKTPPPAYPDALRRDGISGMVAVRVLVDESGNVAECEVTKSSRSEFEQPALNAIRTWKFKPASKDGSAVRSRLVIPIAFSAGE